MTTTDDREIHRLLDFLALYQTSSLEALNYKYVMMKEHKEGYFVPIG